MSNANIVARYSSGTTTAANPTVTVTAPVASGDVLLLFTTFATGGNPGTATSGLGATWSKVANTLTTVSEVWIGIGATGTGTVTHAATGDGNGRALNLVHVSGTTGTVVGAQSSPGTGTATSSPVLSAGNGQIVFGTAYTMVAGGGGISGLTPATGWTQQPTQSLVYYWDQISRIPTSTANHSFTGTYYMQEVVLGDLTPSAMGRTNYCFNPSFEVDMSSWSIGGTRVTTETYYGGASCQTPVLSTGGAVIAYGMDGTNNKTAAAVPVTPGEVWSISYYAKAVSSAGDVGVRTLFMNSSGAFSSDTGNPLTTTTDTRRWNRVSTTVTVPAGVAWMGFAPVGGTAIYMDAVLIEKSSSPGPFFDGNSDQSSWSGTANNSISTNTGNATWRTNLFNGGSMENSYPSDAGNCTLAQSTTTGVVHGKKSLAITPNSANNDSYAGSNVAGTIFSSDYATSSQQLAAGKTYTVSGYLTLTAPLTGTLHSRALAIDVFTKASGGSYVETLSTQAANVAGTTRLSVTFTTPANMVECFIRLYHGGSTGSGVVYWDSLLLEEGSTLGAYFDGSFAPSAGKWYEWYGNSHYSKSMEYTGTRPMTVEGVWKSAPVITTANPTVTIGGNVGLGDVVIVATSQGNGFGNDVTAVSGLGATWTMLGSWPFGSVWKGIGSTDTGTITATCPAGEHAVEAYVFRGASTKVAAYFNGGSGWAGGVTASYGQIAFGVGETATSGNEFVPTGAYSPAISNYVYNIAGNELQSRAASGTRYIAPIWRIPPASERNPVTHQISFDGNGYTIVVGDAIAPVKTRQNLVANPSWETGTNNWTPNTQTRQSGSAALKGTYGAGSLALAASDKQPATAGATYTASGYCIINAATTASFGVTVNFYDSAGNELSPPTFTYTSVPQSTWTRAYQTRVAPAGTTQVCMKYSTNGSTYIATTYDAFLLEQSATVNSYFDGSYPYCSWDGAAHASTSTMNAPIIKVKERSGGAFVPRWAVAKYWNAKEQAWVERRPKRWNGSAWVDLT